MSPSAHETTHSPIAVAIFVPVGLLTVCYVISASIYFDLSWILFGLTSVWAGIDSNKIEFKRYKSGFAKSPISLFCLCYLLWIVIFPAYLLVRTKIKNGTAELKDETIESIGPVKRFFRRVSRFAERTAVWVLILIVALKMVFLMFCIEEYWRGHYVWENYRHELEAKGESFDWNAMVPPMVPDSQNFFSAPMMSEWFIKPSGKIQITGDLSNYFNYTNGTAATVIADLIVIQPGAPAGPGKPAIVLKFDDSTSREGAMSAIQSVIGPFAFGAQGGSIFATNLPNLNQTKPLRICFESKKQKTVHDLLLFFNDKNTQDGSLTIRPVGTNSFQLLASFSVASDYLRWGNQNQILFDRIREALKRPYARMEGDYSYPPTIPIPNFVAVRAVAQTLAQRAQCYLLLGQPGNALHELILLHDLCHILEAAPTGKPMSLVSAMINAAITGLYVDTVADGFRMHAWQEQHLTVIQRQLEQINLTPIVYEAFRGEQVSACRTLQTVMAQLETRRDPNATLWQKIKNLRPPNILRGIFDLNMVNVTKLDQMVIDSINPAQKIILPEKMAEFQRAEDALAHHALPYNFYASIVVPNYTSAVKAFGFNQTKADEAQIVCALERNHFAHGKYPETLNELVPQFIDSLPHDIIGGQPLKYRQTTDGSFLLYSVGWNAVDDGGKLSLFPYTYGDWVWQ